jgi:hypothetical protein
VFRHQLIQNKTKRNQPNKHVLPIFAVHFLRFSDTKLAQTKQTYHNLDIILKHIIDLAMVVLNLTAG